MLGVISRLGSYMWALPLHVAALVISVPVPGVVVMGSLSLIPKDRSLVMSGIYLGGSPGLVWGHLHWRGIYLRMQYPISLPHPLLIHLCSL